MLHNQMTSHDQATAPEKFYTEREPTLEELLEDPVIRLMMQSDGVRIEDLTSFLANIRTRLLAGRSRQAA